MKTLKTLLKIFLKSLVGLAALAVGVAGVWLCWNYVVPDIFGLPEINAYQSLALIVLGNLLFSVPKLRFRWPDFRFKKSSRLTKLEPVKKNINNDENMMSAAKSTSSKN